MIKKINHNWINTALIVIVGILVLVGSNQSGNLGGTRFPSGLSADSTSPSSGEVRGTTLTITGAQTLTGATTLASTLGVTGAATLSSTLSVSGATSLETLTEGGGIRATSTDNATETLLASDIDVENYLDYTPNINSTLTLPATSTLSAMIPNAGDSRQILFRNASTTAAATLTVAAGTGIDLQYTEATGGDLVLNGLDVAITTWVRKSDTDILVIWDEFTEAD